MSANNGIRLTVDTELLIEQEGRLQEINKQIAQAADGFVEMSKKLRDLWVTPAGSGFLQNMALPTAEDLRDMKLHLEQLCIQLQDSAGIYRTAEETATQKAEDLPEDIVF